MQEQDLIRKAQKGDWRAFGELVRAHDGAVLALAARYVRNAEDAKDIYQEVLIRVYRGLPSFRGESLFSTWIHRITVNVCLSFIRTRRREDDGSDSPIPADGSDREVQEPVSPGPLPDRRTMDGEITDRIARAILTLSPRQRMVFTLYHEQDLKLKEIAQSLDCSEGTVKRYLFEATRAMRRELSDLL